MTSNVCLFKLNQTFGNRLRLTLVGHDYLIDSMIDRLHFKVVHLQAIFVIVLASSEKLIVLCVSALRRLSIKLRLTESKVWPPFRT